ncbi:hypothetical protein [Streptomyces aureus]|uniref:hypothetical protein n=1 Tax=Streptomyces aureus TaxID=193461 RepID=UPI00055C8F97|nr:hypothetical protein [Streptomyces aureus]
MVSLARCASRRLGYRGAALLICGAGWINWGLSLTMDPRYGTARGASALTAIPGASMTVWGWIWITSGVVCCAAAVFPARRDWWGWAAAVGMPVVWAAAYTSARALGQFPQGLSSGLTWLVSPGLATVVAVSTRRLVYQRRECKGLIWENSELRREVASLRRAVDPPERGAGIHE